MFKSIFATVLFSCSAFAGSTCFQSEQPVPSSLPEKICFENMTVEKFASNYFITVEGGVLAGRYLAKSEAQRNGMMDLAFRSNLDNQIDAGCGYGQTADARVEVQALNQELLLDTATVSVEITETADTCHQDATTRSISYHRVP